MDQRLLLKTLCNFVVRIAFQYGTSDKQSVSGPIGIIDSQRTYEALECFVAVIFVDRLFVEFVRVKAFFILARAEPFVESRKGDQRSAGRGLRGDGILQSLPFVQRGAFVGRLRCRACRSL